MTKEIRITGDNVDYDKSSFAGGIKKIYGFKKFKTVEKFIKHLHNRNMKTHEAEKKQNEFAEKFDKLRAYPPRGSKYTALKESFFQNAKQFLSQIF